METPILDNIIKKSNIFTLKSLIRVVEQVLRDEPLDPAKMNLEVERVKLLREFQETGSATLTLQAIPEIAVSELGWTNIEGEGVEEVPGPERERLIQFLKNIKGNDFLEKIESLSQFYDDPDAAMAQMFEDKPQASSAAKIATALSYLVFFKTLTKVISNFNAASAGFNFEAFLAVLANGYQVPANTGTIADFVSRIDADSQGEVPISLKLYQDKKLHVGGSFTDLVIDLVEPKFSNSPFMRYLAVTKKFDHKKKEGLDVNGVLRWYRFDFTLDNVFEIISKSSSKSRECVRLPSSYISGEIEDFEATLPGSMLPSPEVMEKVFVKALKMEINDMNLTTYADTPELQIDEETLDLITKNLNWSTNDDLFLHYDPNKVPMEKLKAKCKNGNDRACEELEAWELQPIYKSRGNSKMSKQAGKEQYQNVYNTVLQTISAIESVSPDPDTVTLPDGNVSHREPKYDPKDKRVIKLAKNITGRIANANNGGGASGKNSVMNTYSKSVLNDRRSKKLSEPGVFASIEDSVAHYNELGPDEKKRALKQTYGFLTTEQFNLNQNTVAEIHLKTDKKVLPDNQSEPLFGEILVGVNNTQNMLNRITSILNDAIFDIFVNIKSVQDNSYSYIAGGMQDDALAEDAITSSKEIIAKTEELQSGSSQENT